MPPPLGDIAHIGHVELLAPDVERSVRFFTGILGLTENGRSGGSVYLRTFDDYEHHSLVLTASAMPGVRRTSLRASRAEALLRRVAATKEAMDSRDGGPRTSRASARCASPPTRTATNWPSPTRPSGTRRRPS
jgi:catechol 2,3-dioxygenase-like lactoylglutathione lyase family enzyme